MQAGSISPTPKVVKVLPGIVRHVHPPALNAAIADESKAQDPSKWFLDDDRESERQRLMMLQPMLRTAAAAALRLGNVAAHRRLTQAVKAGVPPLSSPTPTPKKKQSTSAKKPVDPDEHVPTRGELSVAEKTMRRVTSEAKLKQKHARRRRRSRVGHLFAHFPKLEPLPPRPSTAAISSHVSSVIEDVRQQVASKYAVSKKGGLQLAAVHEEMQPTSPDSEYLDAFHDSDAEDDEDEVMFTPRRLAAAAVAPPQPSPLDHVIHTSQSTGLLPAKLRFHQLTPSQLGLGGLGFGDARAGVVAAGASAVQAVEFVSMKDNRLSQIGAADILPSLDLSLLKYLDLSFNKIGWLGSVAVRHILRQARLERLSLEDNDLDELAFTAIADGVVACPTLQVLVLRQNRAGDGGAVAISRALVGATAECEAAFTAAVQAAEASVPDSHFPMQARLKPAQSSSSTAPPKTPKTPSRKTKQPPAAPAAPVNLTQLDLAWNRIEVSGMRALFLMLAKQTSLQVVDLSFNSVANGGDSSIAIGGLQQCFAGNTCLTHLDLSHTGLRKAHQIPLQAGLRNNHSLSGLHLTGTELDLNSVGNVVCVTEPAAPVDRHAAALAALWLAVRRLIDDNPHATKQVARDTLIHFSESDRQDDLIAATAALHKYSPSHSCWICGAWRPFMFKWRVGSSGPSARVVHLRASFDDWRPAPMRCTLDTDGSFSLERMVPACRFFFVFEVDGKLRVAEDEMFECTDPSTSAAVRPRGSWKVERGNDGFLLSGLKYWNFVGTTEEELRRAAAKAAARAAVASTAMTRFQQMVLSMAKRERLAFEEVGTQPFHVHEDGTPLRPAARDDRRAIVRKRFKMALEYAKAQLKISQLSAVAGREPVTVTIQPRNEYRPGSRGGAPTWSLATSMFASIAVEDDRLQAAAFEADWSRMKVPNFVKEPQMLDQVKRALAANYTTLRAIFKYHAGLTSSLNAFSMSWNVFSRLVSSIHILSDQLKLKDIDSIFIASNVTDPRALHTASKHLKDLNPARELARYEFGEAVVRIANHFARADPTTGTVADWVARVVNEHLLPHGERDDRAAFIRVFLCEETESLFRANASKVQALYGRFSGKHNPPGEAKLMSLDEFMTLMGCAGLISPSACTERAAILACVHSIPTAIDELVSMRHQQMSYIDFCVSIGRIAAAHAGLPDELSLPQRIAAVLGTLAETLEAMQDMALDGQ